MLLVGLRSHRDRPAGTTTIQQQQQQQQQQSQTQNIKTAMAAGLGSSLFIFRGLSSISSHILQEASRPSSSSSSTTSSTTTTTSTSSTPTHNFARDTMGSCHSTPDSGFSSRPGSSASESQAPLMPRPHHQKRTTSSSRSPKPEYRLRLQCTDCTRRNVRCRIAPDLNCNGNTLAYQSPLSSSHRSSSSAAGIVAKNQHNNQLKEWTLAADFCGWSRTREVAIQVLGKHMRVNSHEGGGNEKKKRHGGGSFGDAALKPFRVEDLLEELDRMGVRYESSLGGVREDEEKEVGKGWERM
ncbi:hypothetical protein QBC44DRAFT_295409 [Cladorrhinum sp. PSN332]|nr:hypothetical protein QBC44DRAFT_295409 [Cladorrhinum sp. PSN332]